MRVRHALICELIPTYGHPSASFAPLLQQPQWPLLSPHLPHQLTHRPSNPSLHRATGRQLDVLVCNAAVYLPTAKEPAYNADGVELSVQTNHLGHFLLANLLLEDLKKNKQQSARSNGSDRPSSRLIIVGSITGNTNTLAGEALLTYESTLLIPG